MLCVDLLLVCVFLGVEDLGVVVVDLGAVVRGLTFPLLVGDVVFDLGVAVLLFLGVEVLLGVVVLFLGLVVLGLTALFSLGFVVVLGLDVALSLGVTVLGRTVF